jgi:hypothetical protein
MRARSDWQGLKDTLPGRAVRCLEEGGRTGSFEEIQNVVSFTIPKFAESGLRVDSAVGWHCTNETSYGQNCISVAKA